MTKWESYNLGQLINHKKGFAFKSKDYAQIGVPIVRVSDLTEQSIDLSTCLRIIEEIAQSLKEYSLSKDDMVITTVGSWLYNPASVVGKVIKVPEQAEGALLNQNAVRLRTKKNANQKFVYYRLKCDDFRDYIVTGAQGSANQAAITLDNIFSFQLELPDLSTQSHIASILSSLDDKIELNRRMNQTLEQMAQALFNHYFVDNIDPDNLPEGWRWGKLGEIVNVKGGTTPSTKELKYWNGNINWTSPRDLSSLSFPVLLNTEKKITEEGLSKISSGLLPKGTLLLSSRAPIGYLAITEIPVAINQGYIAIDCSKGYSNLFMLYWLKTNMNILIQNANGSTFLEVSKSVFRNIDVIIPSLEKVEKYHASVSSMFSMIVSNEKENKILSKIRDTLLPKLMSGEIDVEALMKEEQQPIEKLKTA